MIKTSSLFFCKAVRVAVKRHNRSSCDKSLLALLELPSHPLITLLVALESAKFCRRKFSGCTAHAENWSVIHNSKHRSVIPIPPSTELHEGHIACPFPLHMTYAQSQASYPRTMTWQARCTSHVCALGRGVGKLIKLTGDFELPAHCCGRLNSCPP